MVVVLRMGLGERKEGQAQAGWRQLQQAVALLNRFAMSLYVGVRS